MNVSFARAPAAAAPASFSHVPDSSSSSSHLPQHAATAATLKEQLHACQQALGEAQALAETRRQQWQEAQHQMELLFNSDTSTVSTRTHDLARRVQELLEVNGQLRANAGRLRHSLQQKDEQVLELEQTLGQVQSDQALEQVLTQRQLMEWQQKARSLEQVVQDLKRRQEQPPSRLHNQHHVDVKLERKYRQLQDEHAELLEQTRRNELEWQQQRQHYKHSIGLLEEQVQELREQAWQQQQQLPQQTNGRSVDRSMSLSTAATTSEHSRRSSMSGTGTRITHASQVQQQQQQQLQERLQACLQELEQERLQKLQLEQQVVQLEQQAQNAQRHQQDEQDRVELLQAYLNVSLTTKPSLEAQLQQQIQTSFQELQQRQALEYQTSQTLALKIQQERQDLSRRKEQRQSKLRGTGDTVVVTTDSNTNRALEPQQHQQQQQQYQELLNAKLLLEKSCQELTQTCQALNESKHQAQQGVRQLEEQFNQERQELQARLEQAMQQGDYYSHQVASLQEERQDLVQRLGMAEQQVANLLQEQQQQATVVDTHSQQQQQQQQVKDLQAQVELSQALRKQLEDALSALQDERDDLERQLNQVESVSRSLAPPPAAAVPPDLVNKLQDELDQARMQVQTITSESAERESALRELVTMLQSEREDLNRRLTVWEQEAKELAEQLAQSESDNERIVSESQAAAFAVEAQLRQEMTSLQEAYAKSKEALTLAAELQEELKQELAQAQQANEDLVQQLQESRSDNETLRCEVESFRTVESTLQDSIAALQEEASKLASRLAESQSEQDALQAEHDLLLKERDSLQEIKVAQSDELAAQKERIASLESVMMTQSERLSELELNNELLLNETKSFSEKLQDKSMELDDSIQVQKLLRQELKHSRESIQQLQSETVEVRHSLAMTLESLEKDQAEERDDLLRSVDELEDTQQDLMEKLARTENELEETRIRLSMTEGKTIAQQEEITRLELRIQMIQASAEMAAAGSMGLDEDSDGGSDKVQVFGRGLQVAAVPSVPSGMDNRDHDGPDASGMPEIWMLPTDPSFDAEPRDVNIDGPEPDELEEDAQSLSSSARALLQAAKGLNSKDDSSESTEDERPVPHGGPRFSLEFFKGLTGSWSNDDDESSSSSGSTDDVDETEEVDVGTTVNPADDDGGVGGQSPRYSAGHSSDDASSTSNPIRGVTAQEEPSEKGGGVVRQTPRFSLDFFKGLTGSSSDDSSSSSETTKSALDANAVQASTVAKSAEESGMARNIPFDAAFFKIANACSSSTSSDSSSDSSTTSSKGKKAISTSQRQTPKHSAYFFKQGDDSSATSDSSSETPATEMPKYSSEFFQNDHSNGSDSSISLERNTRNWAQPTAFVGIQRKAPPPPPLPPPPPDSEQESDSSFTWESPYLVEATTGLRDEVRRVKGELNGNNNNDDDNNWALPLMTVSKPTAFVGEAEAADTESTLSLCEEQSFDWEEEARELRAELDELRKWKEEHEPEKEELLSDLRESIRLLESTNADLREELHITDIALEEERMLLDDEEQLRQDFVESIVAMETQVKSLKAQVSELESAKDSLNDEHYLCIDVMFLESDYQINYTKALEAEIGSHEKSLILSLHDEIAEQLQLAADMNYLQCETVRELEREIDHLSSSYVASKSEAKESFMAQQMLSKKLDSANEQIKILTQSHETSISTLLAKLDFAETQHSHNTAREIDLTSALGTARAEADERHMRSEDSIAALRGDLEVARGEIERLSSLVDASKLEAAEALRMKNALLEDLEHANKSIEALQAEAEVAKSRLSVSSAREIDLTSALGTARAEADERHMRSEDSIAALRGDLEVARGEIERLSSLVDASKLEAAEALRMKNALLEDLEHANKSIEALQAEAEVAESRLSVSSAREIDLTSALETARAEADERHMRSEDSIAALRGDLEVARGEREGLSSLVDASKLEAAEALRMKNALLEDLEHANKSIEALQAEAEVAKSRLSVSSAREIDLTSALETARAEADERHMRSEDSIAALRGDLEVARGEIERLSSLVDASKLEAAEALRMKNALLEDLEHANKSIEALQAEAEVAKSRLSVSSAREIDLTSALETARAEADERHMRSEDSIAALRGDLEVARGEREGLSSLVDASKLEAAEALRMKNALLEDLEHANKSIEALQAEAEVAKSRLSVSSAREIDLTSALETARAEADERHMRSEDSIAALRGDLEVARGEIEKLSSLVDASKLEAAEALRMKNALLEDLEHANKSIEVLKGEAEVGKSRAEAKLDELTKVHEEERQSLESLVASLNFELETTGARISEIECFRDRQQDRVDAAASQFQEMERYLNKLKAEKLELKQEGDQRFETACAQLNQLEAKVISLQWEVSSLEKERDELAAQVNGQERRLQGALAELNELEAQVNSLQSEASSLEEERDQLTAQVKVQQGRLESALFELNELEAQVNSLQSEAASLEKEKDELVVQVKGHQERFDGALAQLNDMEDTLLGCQEALETSELRVKALEGKLHSLSAENRSLQNESAVRSLSTTNEQSLIQEIAKLKEERDGLEEELLKQCEKLTASEERSRDLVASNEHLKSHNFDLFDRIEILETTISLLETAKDSLEEQVMSFEETMLASEGDFETTKQHLESQLRELENEESFRRDMVTSFSSEASERESMLRDELKRSREQMVRTEQASSQGFEVQIGADISNTVSVKRQMEGNSVHSRAMTIFIRLKQLFGLLQWFASASQTVCLYGNFFLRLSDLHHEQTIVLERQLQAKDDQLVAAVALSQAASEREMELGRKLENCENLLHDEQVRWMKKQMDHENMINARTQELADTRRFFKDLNDEIEEVKSSLEALASVPTASPVESDRQQEVDAGAKRGFWDVPRNLAAPTSGEVSERVATEVSRLQEEKLFLDRQCADLHEALSIVSNKVVFAHERELALGAKFKVAIEEGKTLSLALEKAEAANRELTLERDRICSLLGDDPEAAILDLKESNAKFASAISRKMESNALLPTAPTVASDRQQEVAPGVLLGVTGNVASPTSGGMSETLTAEVSRLQEEKLFLDRQCADLHEAMSIVSNKLVVAHERELALGAKFEQAIEEGKTLSLALEKAKAANRELTLERDRIRSLLGDDPEAAILDLKESNAKLASAISRNVELESQNLSLSERVVALSSMNTILKTELDLMEASNRALKTRLEDVETPERERSKAFSRHLNRVQENISDDMQGSLIPPITQRKHDMLARPSNNDAAFDELKWRDVEAEELDHAMVAVALDFPVDGNESFERDPSLLKSKLVQEEQHVAPLETNSLGVRKRALLDKASDFEADISRLSALNKQLLAQIDRKQQDEAELLVELERLIFEKSEMECELAMVNGELAVLREASQGHPLPLFAVTTMAGFCSNCGHRRFA